MCSASFAAVPRRAVPQLGGVIYLANSGPFAESSTAVEQTARYVRGATIAVRQTSVASARLPAASGEFARRPPYTQPVRRPPGHARRTHIPPRPPENRLGAGFRTGGRRVCSRDASRFKRTGVPVRLTSETLLTLSTLCSEWPWNFRGMPCAGVATVRPRSSFTVYTFSLFSANRIGFARDARDLPRSCVLAF